MGLYPEAPKPPFVPGYEIAGVIVETGAQVEGFRSGDRVIAGTRFGGYTDEIILPVSQIRKTPSVLTDPEAAAVPVNFMTAWVALQEMARVRRGDRVLIESVAGGVGIAAVQIAAEVGAEIVGLTSSVEKASIVKSLGASTLWTYDHWNESPVSEIGKFDVILNASGGAGLKRAFDRLAPTGRIITFGAADIVSGKRRSLARTVSYLAKTPFFTPFKLMMTNRGIFGLNMLQLFNDERILDRCLDPILRKIEEKKFRPIVGKTYPLEKAGEAQNWLQSRKNIGKVVLTST
jgi:NADPH:quinone reductase-like Zn-dependent oxidoreductase